MDKEGLSDFQLTHYQVMYFNVVNTNVLSEDIQATEFEHKFARQIDTKYITSSKKWAGSVCVTYKANRSELPEGQELSAEIGVLGLFSFDDKNGDNKQAQFEKLLRLNGTAAILSIMRGIVAATSSALGFKPGLIIPSVNLNKMIWDEPEKVE